MENYILTNTEIEGAFRQVNIYPMAEVDGAYLIHWDGFEVGTIKKSDDKWHTDTIELMEAVNELGAFIDSKMDENKI
jgi:hypothetical protein